KGAGNQNIVVVSVRGQQPGEADGKRKHLVRAENDQRPEEIIPTVQCLQNSHGSKSRDHQGTHDSEVDSEFRAAVDPRRIQQFPRQTDGVLPEKEHREGRNGEGNDDTPIRIDEPECDHLLKQREHQNLQRNHHQKQHQKENGVFSFEVIYSQGISDQRREKQGYRREQKSDQQTVFVPCPIDFPLFREEIEIVFQTQYVEIQPEIQSETHQFTRGFKGGQQQGHKRKQRDETETRQKNRCKNPEHHSSFRRSDEHIIRPPC